MYSSLKRDIPLTGESGGASPKLQSSTVYIRLLLCPSTWTFANVRNVLWTRACLGRTYVSGVLLGVDLTSHPSPVSWPIGVGHSQSWELDTPRAGSVRHNGSLALKIRCDGPGPLISSSVGLAGLKLANSTGALTLPDQEASARWYQLSLMRPLQKSCWNEWDLDEKLPSLEIIYTRCALGVHFWRKNRQQPAKIFKKTSRLQQKTMLEPFEQI